MKRKFLITNEGGLHARPATVLVNTASSFQCELQMEYEEKVVNLKSIMGVMSLGIQQGVEVVIYAEGNDAEQALDALEDTIKNQDLGHKV